MTMGDVSSTTAGAVKWLEWGDEPFERAAREKKPVLLSISATWCHWCHVMDRTTYADPEVVALVNERFIPVRVDNDRRPDVNRRYNMGGWPTTAFLNSKGAVLTGFTYVPADRFKRVLRELSAAYAGSPEYHDRPYDLTEGAGFDEPVPAAGSLSYDTVRAIAAAIERSFDREYGGFGTQPKFPHPEALDLALELYARTGRRELLEVAETTLDRMASGGIHDRVMGGFFRYSTTRDWSVPHYEKMLEDNARLLRTYAAAWRLTGEARYAESASRIVEYLDSALWRGPGGYFGSQDADEEYYALGLEDRLKRQAPRVDRAVYVNWNALAASSLVSAAGWLDRPALLRRAGAILDSLLAECYVEGEGMLHYLDDGGPHGGGLFEDQVWMCSALLDAAMSGEFRGREDDYLRAAVDLIEVCFKDYWDGALGGFFDIARAPSRPNGGGPLGTRVKSLRDNARAAEVLRRAASVAALRRGREGESWREPSFYMEMAEACLAAFGGSWREYGLLAAPYAAAVLHFLHPVSVEVGGAPGARAVADIVRRLHHEFMPWVDMVPGAPAGLIMSVCAAGRCLGPAGSVDEALHAIRIASRLQ